MANPACFAFGVSESEQEPQGSEGPGKPHHKSRESQPLCHARHLSDLRSGLSGPA